ncbi:MAG: ATP-dependent DNA helicase RecG [Caldilineaceae bacterium]|nr:ATP-dependent DNA helicase RecG [Caldilineaceae bacterium]
MPNTVLQRLRDVLALEEKREWLADAIAGGFRSFQEIWEADAIKSGLDAAWVRQISERILHYESATRADRAKIARQILGMLDRPARPNPALRHLDQVGTEATNQPLDDDEDPMPTLPPPGPTPPVHRQRRQSTPSADILTASVEKISGIGPTTAQLLTKLGIETVEDLIWHLPSRHDDYSEVRTIADMLPGEQLSVVANLWKVEQRKIGFNRTMVQGIFNDGTGTLRATWWSPYKAKELTEGKTYRLMGKVGLYMGQKTLESPHLEPLRTKALTKGAILPIYPLTEGLKSSEKMSRFIQKAMDEALSAIIDPLPTSLRQRYDLADLKKALEQIHNPESIEALEAARKRLAFDEFFYIQLGVQQRRRELQQATAPALVHEPQLLATFRAALPFALTGAQERVLDEISRDLARTVPMSRLVQGDVGSGKTAVAAGAMLIAAANGAQSALLAPTQILAEQHYRGLSKLLGALTRPDGTPLRVELLTGRVGGSERENVLAGLADGTVDVVVGTTALIQEGVDFHNLAFVVVDEQHRFGVEQRAILRSKGAEGERTPVPHMLVMSATPIPRSLALTIYGDLDVSVIDELPPGRQPITTKRFKPEERERLYAFLGRQIASGRQAYIIYPLVEESDKLDVGAAVEEHTRLSKEIFPNLRLGLLHGRLAGSQKDEIMRAFANRDLDILVSTSVVEVGVDVPNATVMLIEDAERFGLAQLHQFRGRVGRGEHQSYCALISRATNENAVERLEALVETTDGFALAEKDLQLRGPGDFLGTRQSGLPDLRMAQLGDTATLALAQQAAQTLFAEDPNLLKYPLLRARVEKFWRGHGDIN